MFGGFSSELQQTSDNMMNESAAAAAAFTLSGHPMGQSLDMQTPNTWAYKRSAKIDRDSPR